MFEHIRSQFTATFGDDNDLQVIMAPGRVNLIGEYTDFNEGFVFPMTVDRGVYVGIRARTDQQVRVSSSRFGELIEYQLDEFEQPESGHWSCYVLGVVEELRVLGLVPHGFDTVIDGNLNLGAGLSSSAALETATALALQVLFGFDMSRVDVATLCQRVEHRYAGVMCGIMDQFASGLGRSDHALLLDCRTLSHVNIPVNLDDHRIVIISSEVKRELASSAYNERRAQCDEANTQIDTAINHSIKASGFVTIPRETRASVILCPTVNAVMVYTNRLPQLTSNRSPATKNR